MTGGRPVRVVHGVASLLATLALLVGVPLLLVIWVGWPLPTSIPSLDALEQAARSGISDQVVVNTLAVIAWIAWAQFTLALIVESVAVARGHQAIHLPVLPGFQVTAARLVTGILMIVATVQPVRANAAPPPLPVVAEVSVETAVPTVAAIVSSLSDGTDPSLVAQSAAVPTSPDVQPTVTVQRHDSYWAIAERTLGDGLRWKEIRDLNVGRTLPDGTTIAAGDDALRTGWVLLLPADATGDGTIAAAAVEPAPPVADSADRSTVTVEPGDNLWTISEDRLEADLGRDPTDLEIAPYWRDVIDANRDRYVQAGNPNLILPGQVLVLPPTGLASSAPPPQEGAVEQSEPRLDPPMLDGEAEPEQPVEEPVTSTTIAAPTESKAPPPSGEVPASTASPAVDAGDDDAGNDATPLAVAVAGLSSVALAVGLKRLLNRRRRRFAGDHDGQLPGRTPPDQRELHKAVVAQADEDRIDDLQGALGWLAASLAVRSSARRPRVIRHSAGSLEVLLDQPDPNPPAGWTCTDDGTIWTLQEPPDPDGPYEGPLSPAPLLVTIGQPEDDAQLYFDLEAEGLLALTGDPDVATNLARSIVTELTLSPLAETLRVIAVGDIVDPEAKVLEHLTVVDSWDGVVEDDLRAWASQSHEALAENDWANPFVARGHEPDHDALVPVAVVADRPPPPELAEVLRASMPSTVAVVAVGAFDGAVAAIRCEADALNFDMIGLACAPQEVHADELAEMCRLLVATGSPDEQELIEELQVEQDVPASSNGSGPVGDPAHAVADEVLAPEPSEPLAYDVLVRLLGDITVEGGKALKPKATSVVAYLTLHRSVSTERLEEACWFGSDGTSHRKRLRDVMTESRDALGSQHLPANRSGTYIAGPRVRTDLELFEWHVQRAADLEPSEAMQQYRAALDLVTAKPFSYPNAARASYGWVDFEHHATTWEYRVARIAQACAEMHLDADEPGEAITMLRRVVQAIPLNGAVVESLMRAHIANDDRAGAERVYQEHASALEQAKLGDPEDSIELLHLDLQSR